MTNRILTMSQKEIRRLEVIQQVVAKQITQIHASTLLGMTTRQVRNLQCAYLKEGPEALISKRRGQPSNHRLELSVLDEAMTLLKTHYSDFGPTFAHEKLTEQHHLELSVETIRKLMIKEGLWQGKKRKKAHIHQMRARRSQLGELVQIDGSPHDWFEGRAGKCCLLVFIDDATSRIMQLHFAPVESTEAYFEATERYLKQHGRPGAFYSDRHSIFRVNIQEAKHSSGETQFGRALRQLNIQLICANSPQAKGRVEKANGTLQDRLIKEMRLKGISDILAANAYLPEFIEDYNRRFAVEPSNLIDAHSSSLPTEVEFSKIFSQQHPRKVSKNLELSYQHVIYQIQTETPSYTLRGSQVTVCDKKGEITLLYKGKTLKYKTFNKNNRPAQVVTSKELNHVQHKLTPSTKPKANHPWRRGFEERARRATSAARPPTDEKMCLCTTLRDVWTRLLDEMWKASFTTLSPTALTTLRHTDG